LYNFKENKISHLKTWAHLTRRIRHLSALSRKSDTSFAEEYPILKKLMEKESTADIQIVDIASSDGISQSPVYPFFKAGAGGLALELDPIKFALLSFFYRDFLSVKLVRHKATPATTPNILLAAEIPMDFHILNVDIDSYDLDVLLGILSAGFKPKVITLEINEKIPPGIYFKVPFSEEFQWAEDHFYGCSLTAATDEVVPYGYALYSLEFNNAVFVREDLLNPNHDMITPSEAWFQGYFNRLDRTRFFSHNADVDHWGSMPLDLCELEIQKHFKSHLGEYVIRRAL
jgi:hypothetical protein